MDTLALVLASLLFLAGIVGTVLPAMPGPILVFLGMLLYGFMTDFAKLGSDFFGMQAVALAAIFAIDYVAAAIGTRMFGGSRKAALGAILGTIVALVVMGPLGLVVGPVAGAVLAEMSRGADAKAALRVGIGTLIGTLGGTVIKIAAEIVMIVWFFNQALG